jgi:hypothetical protein
MLDYFYWALAKPDEQALPYNCPVFLQLLRGLKTRLLLNELPYPRHMNEIHVAFDSYNTSLKQIKMTINLALLRTRTKFLFNLYSHANS